MYNNFDYQEGVKYQLISNHVEICSITTKKVFRGTDIPLGRLKKSMLYYKVLLIIEDLLYSPSTVVYHETATNINTYFIAEAIRTAYLELVKSIFTKSNITYSAMLAVELLEP